MRPLAQAEPEAPRPRILVVDDEPEVLRALGEVLRSGPFEVLTESDPQAALQALRETEFAVILSDQKMPGLTGLEFLAQARELQPEASRLLITGVLQLDTVIEAINKGEIYRFIVKPWLGEELLVTIRNAVQRYELTMHNAALQVRTTAMNLELQAQVEHAEKQNQELQRLNEALRQNLQNSIELCLRTLETFMPTLGCQSRRVHHVCRVMAETLQMPAEQRQAFEVAAWVHDIGLIAIPRSLVRRWQADPACLQPSELDLIRRHPELGAELARFVHSLAEVSGIIRSHHERFDGKGYPSGLSGEEIPWPARLLAVACGFAERREPAESALEWVQTQAGTAFDPEAVRVLSRALSRTAVPPKEVELLLSELRPGMMLAAGIYTANGLLLVPKGRELTQACIDKVLNHNRTSAISQRLLVYC